MLGHGVSELNNDMSFILNFPTSFELYAAAD